MKRVLVMGLLLSTLAGCRCGDPKPTFSDGYRVGRIEKISHKGLIWKSWEGYLVLQGFNVDGNGNAVRETFEFSVLDADAPHVVPVLEKAQTDGGIVRLHYRQDWMGELRFDTNYFIDRAEPVQRRGDR